MIKVSETDVEMQGTGIVVLEDLAKASKCVMEGLLDIGLSHGEAKKEILNAVLTGVDSAIYESSKSDVQRELIAFTVALSNVLKDKER